MPRYKLLIEYDGSQYAGWQCQQDRRTIQGELEAAVLRFAGENAEIVGAGRTDSGVHATAAVAHVDLSKDCPEYKVMQGINYYLFNDFHEDSPQIAQNEGQKFENRIAVIGAKQVGDDFHARFSAVKRHYLYRIINRRPRLGLDSGRAWQIGEELDVEKMHAAAQLLLGRHDFTTFRDTQCQAKSAEKTLDLLNVKRFGNEVHIAASARSFLHHQVRNMVGTLYLVGKGKWQVGDVKVALEAKDRAKGGPTAPADGLYLIGVDYK